MYPAFTESQFIALRESVRADAKRYLKNHARVHPDTVAYHEDESEVNPRYIEVWFKHLVDGAPLYVKVIDVPNTLSGDIVRGKVVFPTLKTHTEISGNDLLPITPIPPHVEVPLSDLVPEDISVELATLPIVAYDERVHFAKLPKFRRELQNLIKCRGASPHIIDILGRTEDGRIVFPRIDHMSSMVTFDVTYALFRQWALQWAEALCYLHSIGIVHRDVAVRNAMVTADGQNLVVIDLESQYGSNDAPELTLLWRKDPDADPDTLPYTEKTDVFMLGLMLKCMYLGRPPYHFWERDVTLPAPLDDILGRCMAFNVDDRPTMFEVKAMIEGIEIPGHLCES